MAWAKIRSATSAGLAICLLGLPVGGGASSYGLNLPVGVTDLSARVYGLHMLIFWICVVIGIVVFSAMFYSIVRHRRSAGAQAAKFHENTVVEIIWTLVPLFILVGMAVPATRALIATEDTSNSDMSILVTGYQWYWHYEYVDEDISFFSRLSTPRAQIMGLEGKGENYLLEVDNPMVVPVNQRIRILLTADDVIHAWWVPDLAVKKDAIPGFINEMWFQVNEPGTYRGQCAELCGRDHAFMPIVVVALEEDDWQDWLAEQGGGEAPGGAARAGAADDSMGIEDLVARGEGVFNTNCAACHQVGGGGVPGVFPAITDSAVATGPVEGLMNIVLRGKPGTSMAAFGSRLDNVDLAAVMTYQRNALGNNTGDMVTPAQVESAR